MRHQLMLSIPGTDLMSTLIDSAQCFYWQRTGEVFWSVMRAGGDAAAYYLTETAEGVCIVSDAPIDGVFWRAYFDCERDYAALTEQFGWHDSMAAALQAAQGLRVLKQDAWETVVSFILSANNNVGRIRALVAALSRAYGTRVDTDFGPAYAIPTAQQLQAATEAELRALGTGYRAPYLVETSAKIADGFDLNALRNIPYEEAHQALTSLKGVGDKVADCICLFGLWHTCAFPVDVWVERLLIAWFGMEKTSRKRMGQRAMEMLGCEAGIIQQYLFHCARLGLLGDVK